MATINVGGRPVELPDDLDPTKPAPQGAQQLRTPGATPGAPTPSAAPKPELRNPSFRAATSPEAAEWMRSEAARDATRAQTAANKTPVGTQLRQGAAKYMADYRAQRASKPLGPIARSLPWVGAAASGGMAANSAASGDYSGAAVNATDAAASAALLSPAAPAAGLYLAGRAGWDVGSAINEHLIEPNRGLSDAIGGTINQVLRRFGGGVDDSAYLQQRAEERLAAENGGTPKATTPRATSVPATPASAPAPAVAVAPSSAAPAMAATVQEPLPDGVSQIAPGIYRQGNSYSGSVSGLRELGGAAPISVQNAQAAENLAAMQGLRGRSQLRAAAAPTVRPSEFRTPMAVHSGNNFNVRQRLRSLEMAANGSFRTGRERRQAQAAYQQALLSDLAAMMGQPELALKSNSTNATLRNAQTQANAAMYGDDARLAGTIYSADAQERGMRANARASLAKAQADMAARQNDRDIKNADRTRAWAAVYDNDGNLDEAATNRAVSAIDHVIPGYSTMDEQARKQHTPLAEALLGIYRRTHQGRELGLGQAIFGNSNPRLNAMPDLKGGQLKRSGLTGALPGGAGIDGYYIEMPDGRQIALGTGLTSNELKLIRNHLATGAWSF